MRGKPICLFFAQFLILDISADAVLLQIIMVKSLSMINTSNVLQLEAAIVMLIFASPIFFVRSFAVSLDNF